MLASHDPLSSHPFSFKLLPFLWNSPTVTPNTTHPPAHNTKPILPPFSTPQVTPRTTTPPIPFLRQITYTCYLKKIFNTVLCCFLTPFFMTCLYSSIIPSLSTLCPFLPPSLKQLHTTTFHPQLWSIPTLLSL